MEEDANPAQQDPKRFPTELSKWAAYPKKAKRMATAGRDDGDPEDDKIKAGPGEAKAVSAYSPSQSTFDVMNATVKAINMINGKKHAEGGMNLGGNLGGFISSDDFIMDGHHRWIATAMVDPAAPVSGYVAQYPGAQLIPVLNAITVGLLGITKGNPGKGSKEDFNAPNIKNILLKLMKDGIPGKFKKSAGYVQQAVKTHSQGLEGEQGAAAVAEKFAAGVQALDFTTPEGAPDRIEMPVIDDKKKENAMKITLQALNQGWVDVNQDPEQKGAEGAEQELRGPEQGTLNLEEERLLKKVTEGLRRRRVRFAVKRKK